MRSPAVAVVALVAAVLGGLAVLGLGRGAGWIGDGGTHTVVVSAPESAPAAAPEVVRATQKPLLGNGFDPARIYASRSAGVVTIYAHFGSGDTGQVSQGSGFVVSPRGYVLTNSHVITNAGEGSASDPVKPASRLYVEFSDHDSVPATIVGWDVFDDVGVIRVSPGAHRLAPVPLGDSARVAVGDPVAAIGSPFGNENSLAVGVVSAHRSIDSLTSRYSVVDAIQTDTPITHGNSGGPLFDARGRVIGINAQIRSETGGNDAGVGFAVPIDSARRSLQQLVATGHVDYGFVGITTENLTPTLARHFGYPVLRGAVVTYVDPHGPAAKAGVVGGSRNERVNGLPFTRGGDVIVGIDGKPVTSSDDVIRAVAPLPPGRLVSLTIYRGKERRTVAVRLVERPANPT
jgi:S1-C subfamily serine protease